MKKYLFVLSALLWCLPGYGQGDALGFPPYAKLSRGQFDTVNLENLNVVFSIPIVSLSGRGMSVDLRLTYNSNFYYVDNSGGAAFWTASPYLDSSPGGYGWNLSAFNGSVRHSTDTLPCDLDGRGSLHYFGYRYTEADGTARSFSNAELLVGATACWSEITSTGAYADDGSGFYLIADLNNNQTVYSPSGVASSPGFRTLKTADTNGNNWNITGLGSSPTQYTDTLGRVVATLVQYADHWDYQVTDTNGALQTYRLNLQTVQVKTNFSCPRIIEYTSQPLYPPQLPTSLVLPNGRAYTFTYEDTPGSPGWTTGRLKRVTLPSGGYYEYVYPASANDGMWCDTYTAVDSAVANFARNINDGSNTQTWSYTRTPIYQGCQPPNCFPSSWKTRVTPPQLAYDAASNESTYTFTRYPGAYSERIDEKYYQGLESGGQVVRTVQTLTPLPEVHPLPRHSVLTVTLENNLQSRVETDWSNDNQPLEKREYDWGNGAPGPLLRRTSYSYLAGSAYSSRYIRDRVSQKIVRDGSGNIVSRTDFAYDTTSLVCVTGAAQHDDTNYGCSLTTRGNATSVTNYTDPVTPAGPITQTSVYDSLGNLISVMDPGGHTTTFSYADNFTDGINHNAQAYVTAVTYPTTGSVSHIERRQYFWTTGLIAASCGQNYPAAAPCNNSQAPPQSDYAKYAYDSLGRPLTVTRADGGQTTLAYNEIALPISVGSTSNIASTQNLVATTVLDGLGQAKQMQLNSDPQGANYVDITYDALGRKSTISNPHRSGPASTDGITTYQYDALSRATKVIPPDGTATANNVSTAYSGNSTTVTDQAGVRRRFFTDALGRLARVEEPGNGQTGGSPALPGTGSVDIQGWERFWFSCACWDSGSVSITVNGLTKSVAYGQTSASDAIAAALASAFHTDPSSPVDASATNSLVFFTSKTAGQASNYPLSATSWSNDPVHFSPPSFTTASGTTLTGGADAVQASPGSGSLSLSTPAITLYTYDALGNLRTVVQSGSRQRSFTYNSLSQLLSASNPESGTICYGTYSAGQCQSNGYNADGNLITRTDARGVTTNYTYDALHRLTGKTYSDTTPAATFTYDVSSIDGLSSLTNTVGRLVKAATSNTRTVNSYDPMGRPKTQWQCTPANCGTAWFQADYQYDLAGDMTSESNPLGFALSQSFDSAGRLTQISSSLNDAQHPSGLATVSRFWPPGQIQQMALGNGLTETRVYGNRFQPCRINLNSSNTSLTNCSDAIPAGNVLDFTYGFNAGTSNNGNVASWAAAGTQTFNRSYTYDQVNRLSTMGSPGETCLGLSWAYNAWGNRTDQTGSGGSCYEFHVAVSASNQLASPYQYDVAGNLTLDPPPIGMSYQYDAENRLTSVNSGAIASYVYDADGRRVRKIAGSTATDYIYDVTGNVVAEQQGGAWTKGYVYFGADLLAQYDNTANPNTTYFVHKDHLGSTHLLTKMDRSTYDSLDHLPFGEQIAGGTGTTHKFTGYERDAESGNDHAVFRYYTNRLGRFSSPDPLGGDSTDPQSLNLYSYVRNNPVNLTDPLGLREDDGVRSPTEYDWIGPYPAATLDGIDIPLSFVLHLLGSGAARICPNGDCGAVYRWEAVITERPEQTCHTVSQVTECTVVDPPVEFRLVEQTDDKGPGGPFILFGGQGGGHGRFDGPFKTTPPVGPRVVDPMGPHNRVLEALARSRERIKAILEGGKLAFETIIRLLRFPFGSTPIMVCPPETGCGRLPLNNPWGIGPT